MSPARVLPAWPPRRMPISSAATAVSDTNCSVRKFIATPSALLCAQEYCVFGGPEHPGEGYVPQNVR